ncbi:NTP transferase domain-containing protein [Marimonas sp. MJW-29]|uniref:NTP transferase domain-containing protein n=1 Tax=Sulfitobacter sediminis TaxID=3234186 RepID=A0ABV3RQ83_9RHOB
MARFSFPIILLAAGSSSRMRGRDKLLEEVDGVPLLRLQALKAIAASGGPVIVALPPAPHPRYAALKGLDVALVPVPDATEGMNASLRAAFAALPGDAPCAMVLLADLPDLTAQDLMRVGGAVDLQTDTLVWRGVTETGAPGHPIVFRSDLFPVFASLTGDSGGREVIARAKGRVKLIPLAGTRARNDLDTPEDWADWRAQREGS